MKLMCNIRELKIELYLISKFKVLKFRYLDENPDQIFSKNLILPPKVVEEAPLFGKLTLEASKGAKEV
jgi:hypothetical protein